MTLRSLLHPLRENAAALVVGVVLAGALVASNLLFTRRAALPTVGADTPMLSTLLVALGGSRGILSEVLWWRISDLQRKNRYAELVPLTDLLVTLDPASPDTWAYNAWNLAYNISAAHHDAAEKWRWVKRGIALLERGLRAAPQSEVLLRQMGWLFEDKIAGSADEAAAYYRAHLSELPIPEAASAFEARAGGRLNWNEPYVRALYWYDRAFHAPDTLRTLVGLMGGGLPETLVPFFLQTARDAWEDLVPRQQIQIRHILRQLQQDYPHLPEITQFLQEISP